MRLDLKKHGKLLGLIALGLVAIIVITIVVVNVLKPKKIPVSAEYITVTIDGNTSASFALSNGDYTLTDATTFEKTDLYLVSGIGKSISFTQAMDSYIDALLNAQKLSGAEDDVLLFAVESRNEKDFETLTSYFRNSLKQKGCNTRVYSLYIKVKDEKTQELADEFNVSYAKAHLCKRLEKENKKLNAKELVVLSISEIVKKANGVGEDDLVGKVESDTNEEQKNEFVPTPSTPETSSDAGTSSNTSSDATSSDTTSSDSSSSGDTSSDTTSSEKGPSFVVSSDDKGWLSGLY